MYILTRYVVWEVLKYFLATLVALTLVVTPVMGVKEGLDKGAPALVMLWIMPFMLPEILGITIPASMLFSVCSVFGRMTGANEVVAIKSLGISPMAVVWPAIVLATLLSLGTVWMYEIAATWCKPSVRRILAESIEEIAYGMLQKNGSYGTDLDPFSVVVKRVDQRTLIQPMITIKGPPKITISAAEAKIHADLQAHLLRIDCRQGDVDIQDVHGRVRFSFPDWQQRTVPIDIPLPERYHRDWVALRDIPDLTAEIQAGVVESQTTLQALEKIRDANALLGVPESAEDAARIAAKTAEINQKRVLIFRLKTEPYRRWANGFACLCFALIGTPVAMLWRHADALTNFFVCFLPILAVYYPLLMLGDDLSTSGKLLPISFWTGNAILTVPAIALLRWIVKH